LELELLLLMRKANDQPARLSPSDLEPVRDLVGAGAIDYVNILETLHCLNRITGMLNVAPEALPLPLRRFHGLRRLQVFLVGLGMALGDHNNRGFNLSYEQALSDIRPIFVRATGREPETELEVLRDRPKMVEVIRMHLEERDIRSTLNRETVAGIHETVESALPREDEGPGFGDRQGKKPVEELAFVGTRFAYRTTRDMIQALKDEGYDDLGILDLAIAIADANKWARTYRLLDLDPDLLYLRKV